MSRRKDRLHIVNKDIETQRIEINHCKAQNEIRENIIDIHKAERLILIKEIEIEDEIRKEIREENS